MKKTRHKAARGRQKVREGDELLSEHVGDESTVVCIDGVFECHGNQENMSSYLSSRP